MNMDTAKIEALLFCCGEPLAIGKMEKLTGQNRESIEAALQELRAQYKNVARGIMLLQCKDEWQLVTKKEYAPLLQKLVNNECNNELGDAALETFAIVAYRGPIERASIDELRGVNTTVSLRNLLIRGLIERSMGEERGYDVSAEGLRKLGVERREELPEYAAHRTL